MKIGVISDTHLYVPTKELYGLMDGIFSGVSMVLHAGDLTGLDILDAFTETRLFAVSGNMDSYDVIEMFPVKRVVEVEGLRIGLIHGFGFYGNIEDGIRNSFSNVDAIVYGHTHKPANHVKDGVLMFNPGAFSGSSSSKIGRSVGILTIDKGITGKIINI